MRWVLLLTVFLVFLLACSITSVIGGLPQETNVPAGTAIPSPIPVTATKAAETELTVKNETVNLREEPTQNSRVLEVLTGGTKVVFAGECAISPDMTVWIMVKYQSETGWMSANWLNWLDGDLCG